MSIWNKVLVGLIIAASLGMFFMGAWALKACTVWSRAVVQRETQARQLGEENARLTDGVPGQGEPGVRQMRGELHKLLVFQQGVWRDCIAKVKVLPEDRTAEVNVTIGQPKPHGIAKGMVLYAFESADVKNKGRYLGQFVVTKGAESGKEDITLVPAVKLNDREIEKLKSTKGLWLLYELMPQDNHDTFASLSEKELRALLPSEVVAEYLKDGKPASKDDPQDRVVGGKYVRALRDYVILFGSEREHRILLQDTIESAKRDKQLIVDALELARKQEAEAKKQVALAKADLEEANRQKEIVDSYCAKLEERVKTLHARVAELIKTNQAMADQIARFQLEAARRIDERTRAMAQSSPERR
jgi:hypothetical protein